MWTKKICLAISTVRSEAKLKPTIVAKVGSGNGTYDISDWKNGTDKTNNRSAKLTIKEPMKNKFSFGLILQIGTASDRKAKAIKSESMEMAMDITLLSSSSGSPCER